MKSNFMVSTLALVSILVSYAFSQAPNLMVTVYGYNHDEFREQLFSRMHSCNCILTDTKSEADFLATVKVSFNRCKAESDEITCLVEAALAVSNTKPNTKSPAGKIETCQNFL